MPDGDPARRGYEQQDAPARRVGFAGLGVLAVLGLILIGCGVMLGYFHSLERHAPITPVERVTVDPPPPRLQAGPEKDAEIINGQAKEKLRSYGWVDRSAGIAHIPVERAMELLVEHGWPTEQWRIR